MQKIQANFLQDYEKTIQYLEKIEQLNNIIGISINKGEETLDFQSLNELKATLKKEEYDLVKSITVLIMNNKKKGSIYMDKESLSMIVLNMINNLSSEKELKEMISPKTMEEAIIDDGSTYYRFETSGIIAKYDPNNSGYYVLNEDGTWKREGEVRRWLIDAAYDYEEIHPKIEITKK